jgi:hypothetical protein
MQWSSCLRHCASSRKVAGEIPDGVTKMFYWHNLSSRIGVYQTSNRNDYQEYFLKGKGGRCVGLTLLPSCAYCLEICELGSSTTLRDCTGLYRNRFNFTWPRHRVWGSDRWTTVYYIMLSYDRWKCACMYEGTERLGVYDDVSFHRINLWKLLPLTVKRHT